MGKAENDTTKAITAYIRMMGGVVERVQSGNHPRTYTAKDGRQARHYVQGATKGTADLIGVWSGTPLAIEVKTPTGKVSKEQREWGEAWEKAGGYYVVARTLDDVHTFIRKYTNEMPKL
jgi:hypothetical protein